MGLCWGRRPDLTYTCQRPRALEMRNVSSATEEPRAGSPVPVRQEVQPCSSAGGPAWRTFSRTPSRLLPASRLLPRDG